jgi:hypothetical protein
MELWVAMGVKPNGRVDEPLRAALRAIDLDTGAVGDVLRWVSPAAHVASEAEHQEFTAGWVEGGALWQPTRSELLRIDLASRQIVKVVDHPWFHDLHAVAPWRGGLAVASTGVEAILALDASGRLVETWDLGGRLARLAPDTDVRRWPFDATKPRTIHPNHLWPDGERLWVTELETRRCRSLDGQVAPLPGPPHDGRVREGRWWFTTVDGRVIGLNPVSHVVEVELDVPALEARPGLSGWCRAVEVVGSRLYVGMTMLRSGRHREWLRRALRGEDGEKLPTRVLEIDLRTRTVLRSFEVGNAAGGTIYGLYAIA